MPTMTWAVDADGDWSNAADWSGGAVPPEGAAVTLASADPHTVTHSRGSDTIATLLAVTDTLSLTGGDLAVQSGATFDQTLTVTGGTLALAGASNATDGTFALDQADLRVATGARLTAAAGVAMGQSGGLTAAATTIEGGGTLTSAGSTVIQSALLLGGGLTWSNTGTVTDVAYMQIGTTLGATATIVNAAGAVFDLTSTASGIGSSTVVLNGVTETGLSTFDNAGLFEITGAADANSISSFLVNSGTLAVDGGTLFLYGGGTLGGTITGGGALWLSDGTYRISRAVVLDDTAVTLFAGTVTIGAAQSVSWLTVAGGEVDGPGTLLNTGTMSASAGQITLGGGLTLRNTGLLVLNSTDLYAGNGGTAATTIDNAAGATLEIDDYAAISAYLAGSATPRVINAGLIWSNAATGAIGGEIQASLTNTGTVRIETGVLTLSGGGTLGGVITGGGTLEFSAGSFALTAAKRQGGTELLLAGGTVAIAAGHTLSDLTLGRGEIDGPGTLATAASVAPPGNVSLALGGGLTWSNSASVSVGAITIGTAGATIINTAKGVLDFAGDTSILNPQAGAARLTNAGLLEKTAGTGTSDVAAEVDSTGTLKVASGALALQAGGTISGRIEGDGTLLLAFGQFVLQSPSISGTKIILAGGTLAIAAGQTASPAFSGGEIDGPGTLATSGTVAVAAALGLTLGGGVTWSNSGTVTVQGAIEAGDAAGPTAGFVNTGTFDLAADVGIAVGTGDNVAFTNAGLLEKTAGTGVSTFAASLTNTGTLRVASGTLDLTGGGTIGGTLAGGGLVLLGGGGFTVAPVLTAGTGLFLAGGTVAIAAHTTLSALGLLGGEVDGPGTFAPAAAVAGAVRLGGGAVWRNAATFVADQITLGDAVSQSATIVNTAAGVFGFAAASGGPDATISNAGQMVFDPRLAASAPADSTLGAVLNTAGTFTVGSGVLILDAGGILRGLINGAGQLGLDGGGFALGGLTEAVPTTLVLDSGTASLAVRSHAQLNGTFDQDGGLLRLGQSSVLTATGTLRLGLALLSTAQIDGPGTLVTSGHSFVADTNYTDGTALLLGGGAVWRNTGTVDDGGFIRIGDGLGLTAAFANTGLFAITSDDGGIGNNAVLSPQGVWQVGAASFANAGRLDKTAGSGTSFVTASVTNTGTIAAASGALAFTRAIAGTGTVQIGAGATLETVGFAQTQHVAFKGAGTLRLDRAQSVTGAITGLGVGSAFDLAFAAGATATITGSTLSITPVGGSALTFLSATSLASDAASVAADGHGGTLITLAAAPHAAHAPGFAAGAAAQLIAMTLAGAGLVTAAIPYADLIAPHI